MKNKALKIILSLTALVLIAAFVLSSCAAQDTVDRDDTWREKWTKMITTGQKELQFVSALYEPGNAYKKNNFDYDDPEKPGVLQPDYTFSGEIKLNDKAIKVILRELKKLDVENFRGSKYFTYTDAVKREAMDSPWIYIRIVADATVVDEKFNYDEKNGYNDDTGSGYKYALAIRIYESGIVRLDDYTERCFLSSEERVDFFKIKELVSELYEVK